MEQKPFCTIIYNVKIVVKAHEYEMLGTLRINKFKKT